MMYIGLQLKVNKYPGPILIRINGWENNRKDRQISYAEEFQIVYKEFLFWGTVDNSPVHNGSFKKGQYGKRDERSQTSTTSVGWSRSAPTAMSYVDTMWNDVMRMLFHLWGLPLNNLSLIVSETSDKSQLRNILQNTWQILLKTVKVMKNKESRRNCHSQIGP